MPLPLLVQMGLLNLGTTIVSYAINKSASEEAENKIRRLREEEIAGAKEQAEKTRAELTSLISTWPTLGFDPEHKAGLTRELQESVQKSREDATKRIQLAAQAAGTGASLITTGPEGRLGQIEQRAQELLVKGEQKISLQDAILRERQEEAKRKAVFEVTQGAIPDVASLQAKFNELEAARIAGDVDTTAKLMADISSSLSNLAAYQTAIQQFEGQPVTPGVTTPGAAPGVVTPTPGATGPDRVKNIFRTQNLFAAPAGRTQ